MKNVKLSVRKLARQGFSLVEMIVVIAVTGFIAIIAVPNIGNAAVNSKLAGYNGSPGLIAHQVCDNPGAVVTNNAKSVGDIYTQGNYGPGNNAVSNGRDHWNGITHDAPTVKSDTAAAVPADDAPVTN